MKVIIIGAGGHARVVLDILRYNPKIKVFCFINKFIKYPNEKIDGIPIYGNISVLPKFIKKGIKNFIVAVGDNKVRASYFKQLIKLGMTPINAIHPTAIIAKNAKIGKGVVIAAGSIICPEAKIGNNVIINTGTIVEHHDVIEDHVHMAPGIRSSGDVTVGNGSFLGVGTTIIQKIKIGRNVVVGAGSVIIRDVPDNTVVVGVPTRVIKKLNPDKEFGEQQIYKIKKLKERHDFS
jgi:UDP-perosamine 4-acetyltransferase